MLSFDPATHTYAINGKPVPSVSKILEPMQELEGIPRDVLEAARERGQMVHRAIHLDLHKNLDWAGLDVKLVPYVMAARKFMKENEVKMLASEYQVCDPDLKVAGMLDLMGLFKRRTWIIDWKAVAGTPSKTWGPQVAAYDRLYRRNLGGTREFARAVVQLFDDSSYKLHVYADSRDWTIFASALNLWHFMNG